MPKSPEEMEVSMIANLKEKTGKTLAQWKKLVDSMAASKHGQIVKALKQDHGVTHGFANLIAHKSMAGSGDATTDPLAAQYAGDKKSLRPIYDAIVRTAKKLGRDVELSPKKAYVSLRRSKQFALVQPSTKTRVDLGLNLKGIPASGRLEASGSFNSMCTHRIRLESKKDVDSEIARWLKKAYEQA